MDKKIIIHSVPYNPDVCGGIRAHYQLSSIEKELGYDSFIVYNGNKIPDTSWFSHDCVEYTEDGFKKFLADTNRSVFLTVGWEEPPSLDIIKNAEHRVSYIQGHVFFKGHAAYTGAKLWFNSKYAKVACDPNGKGRIVNPYIADVFRSSGYYNRWTYKENLTLLVQKRKQGQEAINKVLSYLSEDIKQRLTIVIHSDSNEKEFSAALLRADIFFAHSFPEGLNLPPLEAMATNTLVVGYTGGGGNDYMRHETNCLIANDGDSKKVAQYLQKIVEGHYNGVEGLLVMAYNTSTLWGRDNTKQQLQTAIGDLL